METRANYVAVGAFALAAIVAVFTMLYWMGKYGDGEDLVPVDFRIQGSVSGLSKGSTVQFNGITIGRVTGLSLDEDPQFVIVHAEIQSAAPVRKDTRATIGVRGLSGGAFIQLEGGSRESPSLFKVAAGEEDKVPMIQGDPAALADLMTRVSAIAARTERVMGTLEKFVSTNNATVSSTLNNVETFSKALASNSEGVGKFMDSAGNVAIALERLTKQLDGSAERVEGILAAVDPQKVSSTVTNIEEFSKSLADQRTQLTTVMAGVSQAVLELNKVSVQLSTTLGKVDGVVSVVDPVAIKTIVAGIGNTVERTEKLVTGTEKIVAGIDTDKVSGAVDSVSAAAKSAEKTIAAMDAAAINALVTDLSKTGAKLSQVLEAVDPNSVKTIVAGIGNTVERTEKLVAGTEKIVAGIDAEKVSTAVDSVSAVAKSAEKTIAAMDAEAINGLVTDLSNTGAKLSQLLEAVDPNGINVAVTNISKAAEGAQSVVADAQGVVSDVKKVTSAIGTRGDDISQMVTNASQLASRLNESSKKIDGILSQVDNLLGEGGNSGLASEAQATLVEVRKAAQSISLSVNRISNNVDSFTRRGLGDVQGLVSDARRSINSVDRVMRNIENNPSSLLTGSGGSAIRETSGGRVRR